MDNLKFIMGSLDSMEYKFQLETALRGIEDPETRRLVEQYLQYRTLFQAAILVVAKLEQDQ